MSNQKATIAITLGDPCGIGPEVVVKALCNIKPFRNFIPVLVGEQKACERMLQVCDVYIEFIEVSDLSHIDKDREDVAWILNPYPLDANSIVPGKPDEHTARAVIKSIEKAVELALSGDVQAVCTAPINKNVLAQYGFKFPGHTEFLKFLTGSPDAVMMFVAGSRLRVSLVTIHLPLVDVSKNLSTDKICRVIEITGKSLVRFFGIKKPRIAVCGLNPHAGENNMFGHEESAIIRPAIEKSNDTCFFEVSGPFPADTLFFKAYSGEFDAVVAMYHDQGLIPIKLLHFHDAVNATLGLPIVRTSVDHGTAYDIAGKGIANPGSMEAAIKLALFMIKNSKTYSNETR